MPIKLTAEQQGEILGFVRQTIELNYKPNSGEYRDLMVQVYESLSTFEMPDTGEVLPRYKVNKAHEIVNKVVPRVFAKSPKFQVYARTDTFFDESANLTGADRINSLEMNQKISSAVQDYLNVLFEDQDLQESLKLWVKNQIVYGNAYAQIVPKYKITRSLDKNQKVNEKLVSSLPTIDVVSWTEVFYDPRYKKLNDMPGFARIRKGVRLQDLFFAKDDKGEKKYFNLDKIESLAGQDYNGTDSYSQQIYSITGVSNVVADNGIDKNTLTLQEFEGKYSIDGNPDNERLYRITTIDYAVVIGIEEITQLSIVDIKCHEDPETFFSTGFVAPMMGLQDELNFQKNAHALSISQGLNSQWQWAPQSGVDPSDLIGNEPGKIIVCPDGVDQAQRHLVQLQHNPLPAGYFNNINDMNRDINNVTHTIDVSGPSGQSSQINTATGVRSAFFESSAVIDEVRKNFERGARELAYKLLQWTVDNIEDNIIIKQIDQDKFLEINIEAFKNAVERYDIRVEAGSSSFDSAETRMNDAIALKNILIEAANAGVNIDLNEAFKGILGNFEGIDPNTIIKPVPQQQIINNVPKGDTAGIKEEFNAANLTQEVVQGNLTQGL